MGIPRHRYDMGVAILVGIVVRNQFSHIEKMPAQIK